MSNNQEEQNKQEAAFAAMGKLVLDNEAYKQVMTYIKAQAFNDFCKSGHEDGEARELAWLTMQNILAIEAFFQNVLETGRMANITLEQIAQMNKGKP